MIVVVLGAVALMAAAYYYLTQEQTTTDLPFVDTAPIAASSSEDLPAGGSGGPGPDGIAQWRDLAEKYAGIYGILEPEEILAIIWNESSGDPNQSNPSDPSFGLMGVELPVGRQYAGVADEGDLYDPETNIRAGAGFLAYLKSKYEDRFPLSDSRNGWVQMYNTGEPKFLQHGVRNTGYQSAFLSHLANLGG